MRVYVPGANGCVLVSVSVAPPGVRPSGLVTTTSGTAGGVRAVSSNRAVVVGPANDSAGTEKLAAPVLLLTARVVPAPNVKLPAAVTGLTRRVPATTVVGPVAPRAPAKCRVPGPSFVSVPAPAVAPVRART